MTSDGIWGLAYQPFRTRTISPERQADAIRPGPAPRRLSSDARATPPSETTWS
ncbi:MAG TPA: hypothetical protein VNT53_10225 [Pseudolysinimonas sp.]|nr:hypothetical protein [Pseudolysinimonas sp.]